MRRIVFAFIRLGWLALWLLGGVPIGWAQPASVYTVVSTADTPDAVPGNNICADSNGLCTLRAAVMEANDHIGPDTIVLGADTFHLTIQGATEDAGATGDLDLQGHISVQGAGATQSIIEAAGLNDRVVQVLTGAVASISDVTIRGGVVPTTGTTIGGGLLNTGIVTLTRVIVRNNQRVGPPGGNRDGAGIANAGSGWLALNDSQVTANTADLGAITNRLGTMIINNSRVYANQALYGGGIENEGTLTIRNSQVTTNTVTHNGAGINNFSLLDISNSIISGNRITAAGGLGGGIYNDGRLTVSHALISGNEADAGAGLAQSSLAGQPVATITSSTLRDNVATSSGGGLVAAFGTLTLTASLVQHNGAGLDGGGAVVAGAATLRAINSTLESNHANRHGGGVYLNSGTFEGYNITVAHNFANTDGSGSGHGGGLYRVSSGTVTLYNSLVAYNLGVDVQHFIFDDDCFGLFGMFRYSLVGVTTGCTFTNDNTLAGANPLLLELADNGGPTLTIGLTPGSVAIDAGDPAGCVSPAGGLLLGDQRGWPRQADSNYDGVARCDMGAFEVPFELFLPVLLR